MHRISYLIALFAFSVQAQITFQKGEWNALLQQAEESEKLVFIYAYAQWCEPCQEMEEYIFADLEVSNFYNQNFINVALDMETYPGLDLAEQFAVGAYPSFLFVNAENQVVHRGCGGMDTADILEMGRAALDDKTNLLSFEKQYKAGVDSVGFLLNYLAILEFVCLDAEQFASDFLASIPTEELITEESWAVMASYQWDIYSREFQHLIKNQKAYGEAIGSDAVQAKIYDTYLAQYQEIYESEELHDFGMRALMNALSQTTFSGVDTLRLMTNLHYAEYSENWSDYAEHAIDYVGMMELSNPEELSELAWKFYLFVEDSKQLEIAAGWASEAVDKQPEPSIIDTYASLSFKMGDKKKAIELEEKALELAKKLYEDIEHYEYQLSRFRGD